MPAPDPRLEALRARLDAALAGRSRLSADDLRTLISSWELMRRALSEAPPPQIAIDTQEVPHRLWYGGARRAALDAAIDGTGLEYIDAVAGAAPGAAAGGDDRGTTLSLARDLAANWEAHHGPLPPVARRRG